MTISAENSGEEHVHWTEGVHAKCNGPRLRVGQGLLEVMLFQLRFEDK